MNSEIINSFSLVGRISNINKIKKQSNGRKYRYFTLVQNNKYKDRNGNFIEVYSFFNIKLYEKYFESFERVLKVGKYINIFGKINVYKDNESKIKMYLVATAYRESINNKKIEIFDYDWLNEGE